MPKRYATILSLAACLSFVCTTGFSGDTIESVFKKWHSACLSGDLDQASSLTSASAKEQVKKAFEQGMTREQLAKMQKVSEPLRYKVLNKTFSADQTKASLFVEGPMKDWITLAGQKPKVTMTKGEIQFVKEEGIWKINLICYAENGCSQ